MSSLDHLVVCVDGAEYYFDRFALGLILLSIFIL